MEDGEPADRGSMAGSAGEVFREPMESTGQRPGAAEEGWEADIPYKKQTSETRAGRIFLDPAHVVFRLPPGLFAQKNI